MSKTILDVGAFDGQEFLEMCRADSKLSVHAFEPVPSRYAAICELTNKLSRYHVHHVAVSDYDGFAEFHLCYDAFGCDSLMEFVDDVDDNWSSPFGLVNRDFRVRETIQVDVIRLDTFLRLKGINEVSFLHVDAQGSDLRVLKSLGELIHTVQGGVVEAATTMPLYKDQPLQEEIEAFLLESGFNISKRSPQHFGMEVNISFSR